MNCLKCETCRFYDVNTGYCKMFDNYHNIDEKCQKHAKKGYVGYIYNLTFQEEQQICEMHESGKFFDTEIARQFKVPVRVIQKVLEKYGLHKI